MTTTVRRGTGRAAAKAEQNKASQRSNSVHPLGTLEKIGIEQLKQYARSAGFQNLDAVTKPVLVEAMYQYPDGPPADKREIVVTTTTKESKVNTTAATESSPGVDLAQRIAAARESGYSRKDIADASNLTQSVIWRIQAKQHVKADELPLIAAGLAQIESGTLEPTRRGRPRGATTQTGSTRAALQSKLDKVHEVLSTVPINSNKVTEYRAAITAALDVIDDNA